MNLPNKIDPLPCMDLRNKRDGGSGPLGKGDKRTDIVKRLHVMLITLGYDIVGDIKYDINSKDSDIDHFFGKYTEYSVRQFQRNNRDWNGTPLSRDGLVGPKTSDALNRSMVGLYYNLYQTPNELSQDVPILTVTKNELQKNGLSLNHGKNSRRARVYLVPPPHSIQIFVNDTNGNSLQDIDFEIELESGEIIKGKTDKEGMIQRDDLQSSKFILRLIPIPELRNVSSNK